MRHFGPRRNYTELMLISSQWKPPPNNGDTHVTPRSKAALEVSEESDTSEPTGSRAAPATQKVALENERERDSDTAVQGDKSREEMQQRDGFSYFDETPCSQWSLFDYHTSWEKAGHVLDRGKLATALQKQLDWIGKCGTPKEKAKSAELSRLSKKPNIQIQTFWNQVLQDIEAQKLEKFKSSHRRRVVKHVIFQLDVALKSTTKDVRKHLLDTSEDSTKSEEVKKWQLIRFSDNLFNFNVILSSTRDCSRRSLNKAEELKSFHLEKSPTKRRLEAYETDFDDSLCNSIICSTDNKDAAQTNSQNFSSPLDVPGESDNLTLADEHYESFHTKLQNSRPSVDNGRVQDDERQEVTEIVTVEESKKVDDDEFGSKDRILFEQSLVHSFIIDVEDNFVIEAFTEDEMEEILKKKKWARSARDRRRLSLTKYFSVQDSTKEIREELNKLHPRFGANYDPQVDFAYEHVRTTVADWQYRYPGSAFSRCTPIHSLWNYQRLGTVRMSGGRSILPSPISLTLRWR
ncbi:hypothetical protein BC937DRAFT_92903 [Endogone sp. FLAS-F59071]|nr:hypothetical protein BC937DRAFT_92903 [Endogone sp. FLAS-F59071]|eukprot:RUS21374.1 hypothetical protein BC937DRAFT_92903 [Endogone sp. FLAS-F59071]